MTQIVDLVTTFAARRCEHVTVNTAAVQGLVQECRGGMQTQFGILEAHRQSATEELKVPGASTADRWQPRFDRSSS